MPIQYDQIPVASVPPTPAPQQPLGQTPTTPSPNPAPPPPHPVKKLLLAEIIAAEIVIGLVVVFFIFGLLNYFNILALDKSFPALSFLPHQNRASTSAQTFSYDAAKAYASLSQFDDEVLQDTFKQGAKSNQQAGNLFTQDWSPSDPKVFLHQLFSYQLNTNTEQFYKLTVNSLDPGLQTASPSAQAATTVVEHYFKPAIATDKWDCVIDSVQSRCTYRIDANTYTTLFRVYWVPKGGSINLLACKIPAAFPDGLQRCIPSG